VACCLLLVAASPLRLHSTLFCPRRSDQMRRKWRSCTLCKLAPPCCNARACPIMPSNSVTRARAPCLRYTAANAACEQQQASLAELQQQKQQVLSLRDAELAEAREVMQRAVAEKERYKVAPKFTPSAVIQLPCHASLPPAGGGAFSCVTLHPHARWRRFRVPRRPDCGDCKCSCARW